LAKGRWCRLAFARPFASCLVTQCNARPLRAGLPADGEGVEMALAVKGGQVFADARLNLVVVVAGRADVFVPTGLEAVAA